MDGVGKNDGLSPKRRLYSPCELNMQPLIMRCRQKGALTCATKVRVAMWSNADTLCIRLMVVVDSSTDSHHGQVVRMYNPSLESEQTLLYLELLFIGGTLYGSAVTKALSSK